MCHHAHCSHGGDGLSRREFLVVAASAAATSGWLVRPRFLLGAALEGTAASAPPEVRVVYVRPKPEYWLGWPGTSWEKTCYQHVLRESRAQLENFGKELGLRVTFAPEPLYDDAAVDAYVAALQAEPPAGVVVVPLHLYEWGRVGRLAGAGVPTIVFAGLGVCFTGHVQQLSRQTGVHLISAADFDLAPVRYGLKMIRTAHDVRRTRIAVLAGDETRDEVLEPFGLQLRRLPRRRFVDTLKEVGETDEVRAIVADYSRAARRTVEPQPADLVNAARNYVAAARILKEEQCQGITMDCLGAVTDRQIPCPPCLAWSKFLDVGVPAICEADINAVMSLTLCCKLLDKPGFQQDPVPETVHNTFIGAHCVCPTRLHGYDQPRAAFDLRSHSESDIGVSLQVLWPAEQVVTVMQFAGPDRMLLGRGRVLRNLDTPPAGGCRTSVELEVTDGPRDTRDVKGFHQLFIAGDHQRDFQAYGQLYGIATESI